MSTVTEKYFDPKLESVRSARRFVATVLQPWEFAGLADDICLCVSELASNALVHGTSPGHGFLVRLAIEDGFVRLEVHDSRSRLDDRQLQVRHPAPSSASGRGLLIVDALADGWGVEDREPFGKVVWSRFNAAPVRLDSTG